MVTVVVSAVIATAVSGAVTPLVRIIEGATAGPAVADGCVDEAALLNAPVESLAVAPGAMAAGFGGGNSS